MQYVRYNYVVEAAVRMSLEEVRLLHELAKDHPYPWCSSLAEGGGLLYDLRHLLGDSPDALIFLGCKDLTALCQILETPGQDSAMKEGLRQAMAALYKTSSKEQEQINRDRR